jgi:carbamoyltransferase
MIVLGVTHPVNWNNAAALVEDGVVVSAAEEERFTGVKYAPYMAPIHAADWCLKYSGVKLSEVAAVAVGWGYGSSAVKDGARVLQDCVRNYGVRLTDYKGRFGSFLVEELLMRRFISQLRRLDPNVEKKLKFVPHHISHAASTFYLSGFSKSNVLTLDGAGESGSGLMAYYNGDRLEIVRELKYKQSLGQLYSLVTTEIGFNRHADEGKTMGLAAFGKPIIKKSDFVLGNGLNYYIPYDLENRLLRYGPPRSDREELTQVHKNLAASVQAVLEEMVLMLSKDLYETTGCKNFCLAGGVALNCNSNASILSQEYCENIFIQPAAHDAGTAIGAALWVSDQLGVHPKGTMEHASLGPSFTTEETTQIAKEASLKHEVLADKAGTVAELLSKGKIVGWFQSRMEIGPRALGNRSILANPSIDFMKDSVNTKVKHRESWRPFAPSILVDYATQAFQDYYKSPFMILTFNATEKFVPLLRASLHVDDTGRPQEVTREHNQPYFEMIDRFRRATGVPGVLNTSFNDKGMPIVMHPRQAIQMFYTSGMDSLVIEDVLFSKAA